jgi:hypothetical protein
LVSVAVCCASANGTNGPNKRLESEKQVSEPVSGPEGDAMRQQLLVQHGGPAFIRRARAVQEALEGVLNQSRACRDEWLDMVRLRLATLAALAGDWERLRPWLADDEQVAVLRELHAELQPKLLVPVEATSSHWQLRSTLTELLESLERFNRRWREFVPTIDLTRVNEAREKYNRFYLLEKECAVGRAGLTKADFVKLQPMHVDDLVGHLPLLPVPRLRD